MNSKQRVHAAIARQSVDKVPLGFYAVDCDTAEKVLGRKTYVRDKIRMQLALWEGRRDELAAGLKTDAVELYRKLDIADIILPKEAPVLPPRDYTPLGVKKLDGDRYQTGDGRVWKAVWHVNEIQCVHDPRPPKTEYAVADFPEDAPVAMPDESCFEVIDHLIRELGGEKYVVSIVPAAGLVLLGGTENGLAMYALEPEVVHAASRQRLRRLNAQDPVNIRPGSAGAMLDTDMAGSNGPLIGPAMFREMVLPYFKARCEHIKRFRNQLLFHNCGNNIPLMDMFIEAGVDCYQSLQTTAGMEVGLLKERFGRRLAFWGGVAVEKLIAGSPQDVRNDVRTAMRRGAPGGGFILGPSHSIAKNTRYDNFMAMLDEFEKLRDKF